MAEKNRVEGQLWIDRNEPHGLKYRTDGVTYQLVPEKVYNVSGGSDGISKGSLVAIDGTDSFKVAQFPKDIDRVIGICPIDINPGDTKETSILKNGNITLAKNSAVFEHTDVSITWSNMIGAPVYWFIGRTNSGPTYTYIDPSTYKGKLTLATPSGMRWDTGIECTDPSLNVGYSNLPTVGTVVAVSGDNVTINVNISKFESSLEWHWPYYAQYGNSLADLISVNPSPISIRHGLFPNITNQSNENYYNFRTRCFCDAIIIDSNTDDTEHLGLVKVENYYGVAEGEDADTDKRTDILFKGNSSINDKRINISGKVVYGFVKQYE